MNPATSETQGSLNNSPAARPSQPRRKRPILWVAGAFIIALTSLSLTVLFAINDQELPTVVSLLLFLVSWTVGLVLLFVRLGNQENNTRRTLTIIITLCAIVVFLSSESPLGYPFTVCIRLSEVAVLLFATLAIVRLVLRNATPLSTSTIQTAVEGVLASDRYLSILRTTIPSGTEDREHGFDYIPFMLAACNQRREQSLDSARVFLRMTVSIAIVFAITLTFFAYVLVNEAAAGLPKTMENLLQNTRKLESETAWLLPDIAPDSRLATLKDKYLKPLVTGCNVDCPTDATKLSKALEAMGTISNLETFEQTREVLNNFDIKKNSPSEPQLRTQLRKAIEELDNFQKSLPFHIERLRAILADQLTTLADTRKKLSENNNYLAEILKRLGIGLVLASFFIAILRYLAGLYREHYQQSLLANQDELLIRRFYVAYRCSESNSDARKASLDTLLRGVPLSQVEPKDSPAGTNDAQDLLKEIVSTLAKKI